MEIEGLHNRLVKIQGQVGGIENPSSALCNLHIRQSSYLVLVLLLPAAGIDNMRVGISESRENELSG